jgi:hypothetical protein
MRILAFRRARCASALSLALALGLGGLGCGLDDVEIPELDGPSELGLSVKLTVSPDIITADGFSTALITITMRDQNGGPVAGRDVFLSISDEDGRTADIGEFRSSNGPGTGITVRTNSQGLAQAVYEAPARTDATAHQTVLISARPIGTDYAGAVYRTVRLELRSAEPRLFPQNPNNQLPECMFAVQTPSGFRTNVSILFQSTSFDPDGTIVRYEWDFGNGTRSDHSDVNASYRSAGTYTVTHRVTDDDGGQDACGATVTIF